MPLHFAGLSQPSTEQTTPAHFPLYPSGLTRMPRSVRRIADQCFLQRERAWSGRSQPSTSQPMSNALALGTLNLLR